MKIQDFVTTVLVDIEKGVNAAAFQTNRYTYLDSIGEGSEKGVLFDLAVTANAEASGRIGAEVFSVGAKAEGKIANEEVSRIRFIVKVGQYFQRKTITKPEVIEAIKKKIEEEK